VHTIYVISESYFICLYDDYVHASDYAWSNFVFWNWNEFISSFLWKID